MSNQSSSLDKFSNRLRTQGSPKIENKFPSSNSENEREILTTVPKLTCEDLYIVEPSVKRKICSFNLDTEENPNQDGNHCALERKGPYAKTRLNGLTNYIKDLEKMAFSLQNIDQYNKIENTQNSSEFGSDIKNKVCCCPYKSKQNRIITRKMSLELRIKWLKFIRTVSLVNNVICTLKFMLKEGGYRQNRLDATSIEGAEFEECMRHDKFLTGVLHQMKHRTVRPCIILPNNKIGWVWSINIIILLLWSAIYLPYRLAFLDQISIGYFIMELIIDIIFGADIIVNFLTAYYDEKNILITSPSKIAKKYLKTWFIIDLISIVPFQMIINSGQYSKSFRLLRLPRLYKLLKVLRLFKMMRQSEWYNRLVFTIKLNTGIVRLMNVFIVMCFIAHFYACLWYFLAKLENFNPDTWVMRQGIIDQNNTHKYIFAFYWVLQTLTTVGYGDMSIGTNMERLIAITLMIGGVGFYSYTIGNLSSIFSNLDSRQTKLNSKIMALNSFALSVKMDPNLYFKIMQVFKRNSAIGSYTNFDQNELLDELPTALKNDVLNCTHKKILDSFAFFKNKPSPFIMKMLPNFSKLSLSANEAIYRKGDMADEIFFILKGRVGFVTPDGYLFRNFVSGTYFGEQEIFHDTSFRDYTVISMENTELLTIKKLYLENSIELFPEIRQEMEELAFRRINKNMMAINISKKIGFKLQPQKLDSIKNINGFEFKKSCDKEIEFIASTLEKVNESSETETEKNEDSNEEIELILNTNKLDHLESRLSIISHIEENSEESGLSNSNLEIGEEPITSLQVPNSDRSLLKTNREIDEISHKHYNFEQIIHNKPNFLLRENMKSKGEGSITKKIFRIPSNTKNKRRKSQFGVKRGRFQHKSTGYESAKDFSSKNNREDEILNPLQPTTKTFRQNTDLCRISPISMNLKRAEEKINTMLQSSEDLERKLVEVNDLENTALSTRDVILIHRNIEKIIYKIETVIKTNVDLATRITINGLKLSKIEDKMFERVLKGDILW